MFSPRLTRSIAIGAAAIAIGGGTYGIVSGNREHELRHRDDRRVPRPPGQGERVPGGGASNARSGPAAGGSSGTVEQRVRRRASRYRPPRVRR